jgi:hypothetical protein
MALSTYSLTSAASRSSTSIALLIFSIVYGTSQYDTNIFPSERQRVGLSGIYPFLGYYIYIQEVDALEVIDNEKLRLLGGDIWAESIGR